MGRSDAGPAMFGAEDVDYLRLDDLGPDVFVDILRRSGLAPRRPIGDGPRISRMVRNASLVVAARDRRSSEYVGIARALTDFAYCCYVSDLAVDRRYQRRGIGTALLAHIRIHAGPEALCLLVSAPQARSFYEAIGMRAVEGAFLFDRER